MRRRGFLTGSLSMLATPAISRASEDHGVGPGVGVIFIGASWCAYCKSAAPVLAAVTRPAGIPVLVASHDARPIPPFTEVHDARVHTVAASITTFPTTLIYARPEDTITAEITGYRSARHYALSLRQALLVAAGQSE